MLELIGTFCLGAGVLARVGHRLGWSGTPVLEPPDWGLLGYALVGGACLWPDYGTRWIDNDDVRFRIRVTVRGGAGLAGRGARQYPSAGFVIEVAEGAGVVVFVGVHEIKRLRKSLASQHDGVFTCAVRPLDQGGREVPEYLRRNYAWDDAELGTVPAEAKPFTPTGRRMLVMHVDP